MIPQHIHARTLINQLAFGLSNGKLQFDLLIVLRVMGKKTLAMCNVAVTAYKKRRRFHITQFWSKPSFNLDGIKRGVEVKYRLVLG